MRNGVLSSPILGRIEIFDKGGVHLNHGDFCGNLGGSYKLNLLPLKDLIDYVTYTIY